MLKKIIMIWLVSCVGLIGGVAFADSLAGNNLDDSTIEKNVKSALDTSEHPGNYIVVSYKQHVLLAGQVPTASVKEDAEETTTKVVGVVKVWNYLKIQKNETTADIAKDSYLTSMAKAKLLTKTDINSNNIKVITVDRVIYLLGDDVGDKKELNQVIKNIKSSKGVRDLVNLTF